MADSEEYQGQQNSNENAMSQFTADTDKQPLLEADRILSGQPLQASVPEQQPQPRPMYISPEIHPPAKTTLAPENHPEPRQPGWPRSMPPPAQYAPNPYFAQQQQQTNTVVVTQQPGAIVHQQNVPTWIGSDLLIYWSVFTMLFCGLLPGIIALFLAWEARSKKDFGDLEMAKSWSMATIFCNILSMLLGVGAIIGAGVYFGITLNSYHSIYTG